MNFFRIFHRRKRERKTPPQPLRIEGCKTVLTPEPDDAEMAALALLESLAAPPKARDRDVPEPGENDNPASRESKNGTRDSAYYHHLAERIREGMAIDARKATRFVAYCEQELKSPSLPAEQISLLEIGLHRHFDTIEREKGKLKSRWQHCLVECIVRQMSEGSGDDGENVTQSDDPATPLTVTTTAQAVKREP